MEHDAALTSRVYIRGLTVCTLLPKGGLELRPHRVRGAEWIKLRERTLGWIRDAAGAVGVSSFETTPLALVN